MVEYIGKVCPLCNKAGEFFHNKEFLKCYTCQSVFKSPRYLLSSKQEKERYEKHNNNVYDPKYQDFVTPLVKKIQQSHVKSEVGLDFGAGTGPVITHLLEKSGYSVKLYDPFFHNDPHALTKTYNFIIACEVVEHFHAPLREFEKLYNLLKKGGRLYIMTDMYDSKIDFSRWYYKNDPTHVFFYSSETFQWIQKHQEWRNLYITERIIVLEK